MTRGLPPAPRWAWAVMVLGVGAIVVLSYLTLNRPPPPRFTTPASATSTSPPATPSAKRPAEETPAPEPVRVLVVGDGFSTTPAAGGGWPDLVGDDLEAAGRPAEVVVAASDLAGYAEPDAAGILFSGLAQEAGSGFDVVVFFGSRNDVAAAATVRTAATAAFTAAQEASPGAALVAIGPAWPSVPPPGYIVTNRDAVAAAAGAVGAVFVDPLAEGWFTGPSAAFVAQDGVQPTAEGQRYLADLIGPVIERALPAPG